MKSVRSKYLSIVFIIMSLLLGASVAPASEYNAGVESIFNYGAGARAMGMGGAFTAIADDATAIYYNPSGIARLERTELSGMHVSLWEGVNYDCLNLAIPTLDYGYFGFGVMRVGVDDIVRRDVYNVKRGEFGYHQEQYFLTYAIQLTEALSFGASAKVANQSIDSYNASGISNDLGLLFRLPGYNQVTIGMNIQDLYSSGLKLKSENEKTPLNLKAGLGYEIFFGGYQNRILLAFDIDKTERRELQTHFGAEADLMGTFFIRSGYDENGTSFGGGLSYGIIGFDYAFIDNDGLGDAHRFSLSLKFGKPLSVRLRDRIAREESISKERFASFSRQEKIYNANYYVQQGDSLAAAEEYEEAERAYMNALAWVPDYQPAQSRLYEIEPHLEMLRDRERSGVRKSVEVEIAVKRAQELADSLKYLEAVKELDNAQASNPENEVIKTLRERYSSAHQARLKELKLSAYSYYSRKEYTRAFELYRQLVEYEPDNMVAQQRMVEISNKIKAAMHLKQGLQLYSDGNYSLSAAEFQLALNYDPDDRYSREYLNLSQNKMAGVTTLEELKNDRNVWRLYLDGIKAYQEGRFNEAISCWEEVLKAYPTNVNTIRNIEQARLLLEHGGDR
jgi:tetratricopeptide (TPR) repeat protein